MATATKTFWQMIDEQLDTIERDQVNTYEGIKAIMPSDGQSAAPAFFGGGGGDRTLASALRVAGWRINYLEDWYYYNAFHPETGETITYCEGDIYPA